MKKILLHTPEGVRDIYGVSVEHKLHLENVIHKTMKLYGYNDIQTPTFEFFDIFSKEKGSVASKNMYKFFDREGNTLVLRPDMTPSIARAVSKYYMEDDMPIRFCYSGNTFINNAEHQGKLKETTQLGAELIGDDKSDADAEVIALTIDSLLKCGLTDFLIEIGHVDFFNGLFEETHLSEEELDTLKELILNKNYFGIEAMVSKCEMNDIVKKAFITLPELVGSADVLEKANTFAVNEKISKALVRLEKLYNLLKEYGYEKYVSIDLSVTSKFQYYTGIIFSGYTYGVGEAIVNGGRYDKLLSQFGKASPSIGFCINLDYLLIAMERHKIAIEGVSEKQIVLYEYGCSSEAIAKAKELRINNINTELIRKSSKLSLDDYIKYNSNSNVSKIYYYDENGLTEVNTQE